VIWGDKSPSYVAKVEELNRHFPTARFIHIVRDCRDQALSSYSVWGKDILRAAQRWTDDVRSGLDQGVALGARFRWVRYEDLVEDAPVVLNDLCEFLGLDLEPAMLQLERPSENLGDARGSLSIVKDNTGKFRARLSNRKVELIERIAGKLLHDLGYAVDGPRAPLRLSSASMRLRQFKDFLALVRRRSSQDGWVRALKFHWRYQESTSRKNLKSK
jgi:hypothetical protein